MDKKITLTAGAYEKLLAHLVEIEERKRQIVDEVYTPYSSEYNELSELLDNYISKLDNIVKNIEFNDYVNNNFPFVIIDSEVEVVDIDNNETLKYCIVNPYENSHDFNCVSFMSPVGKALLLKEIEDKITVKTPGGIYRYRIKSITLI